MKVKRIVANIPAGDVSLARHFYCDLLSLDVFMDMGWVATFGSDELMRPQLSVTTEGGSGTPVPELSIEVDDLEAALHRFQDAKIPIVYGPTTEPWGVRRFYVHDPFGKLINILTHV